VPRPVLKKADVRSSPSILVAATTAASSSFKNRASGTTALSNLKAEVQSSSSTQVASSSFASSSPSSSSSSSSAYQNSSSGATLRFPVVKKADVQPSSPIASSSSVDIKNTSDPERLGNIVSNFFYLIDNQH